MGGQNLRRFHHPLFDCRASNDISGKFDAHRGDNGMHKVGGDTHCGHEETRKSLSGTLIDYWHVST